MSKNSQLIKNKLSKANQKTKEEVKEEITVDNNVNDNQASNEDETTGVDPNANTGKTDEDKKDSTDESIINAPEKPKRKPRNPASVSIKNKKVIFSIGDNTKHNKTFSLERKYLDLIDSICKETGLGNSQLIQIALDLLVENMEIEEEF